MGMSERQREIMEKLRTRKHDTIKNLAFEFGVSERTIRRDIDALSVIEPIVTQPGRYGGILFVGKIPLNPQYMSDEEIKVLYKFLNMVTNKKQEIFTDKDVHILEGIIKKYQRPT